MVLKASKALLLIFLFYIGWYCEIYGDSFQILYGTVIGATLLIFLNMIISSKGAINELFNKTIYVFVGFGVYALISGLVVCTVPSKLITSLKTYFAFVLVCADIYYLSQEEDSLKWIWNGFIGLAFLCSIQTIFRGVPFRNADVYVKTMGPMNNPNFLARVLLYGVMALTLNGLSFMRKYMLLSITFLGIILYALFLTGSRKCVIAAVIITVFWFLNYLSEERQNEKKNPIMSLLKRGIIVLLFVMAIILIYQNVGSTSTYSRMEDLVKLITEHGTNKRTRMYQEAFEFWKQHPLFGIGFKQFELLSSFGGYSHSTYAEVLSCTGIIGAGILFIPSFSLFFQVIRTAFSTIAVSEVKYKYRMILTCVVAIAFIGIGDILIYGAPDMIMITIIIMYYKSPNNNEQEEFSVHGNSDSDNLQKKSRDGGSRYIKCY